eukprot:snap_masked-scaffold_4-processed-gene-11.43-mRNA-1 protein AED:1.00 eAED:1.00 QI:0/0/0/0/1/1/2/0/425
MKTKTTPEEQDAEKETLLQNITTQQETHKKSNFKAVWLAAASAFVNNYSLTSIFPYSAGLVVYFGKVDSIDQAGFYAGYLTGSFMFARMFTSFFWGQIADDYGRRVSLLISLFSFTILLLVFGLTKTFEQAVFVRVLLGLMNGLIPVSKTVAFESVIKEDQAKASGYISGWANLGMVVGSATGGFVNFPLTGVEQKISSSSIFEQYPFLLPNLIGSILSCLIFICVFLFLPETRKEFDLSKKKGANFLKYFCPFGEMFNLLKTSGKQKATFLYVVFSFGSMFYSEMVLLWYQASEKTHGWEMKSSQVAIPLFSRIHFNSKLYFLTPAHFFRVLLNNLCFISCNLIINNVTISEERGAMNGMVMTLGSFVKSLGPFFGAQLFAWSINSGNSFPFNYYFCFLIVAFVFLILFLYTRYLPDKLNYPIE